MQTMKALFQLVLLQITTLQAEIQVAPVINGNGELIGTAFDGNWEAMSGDIAFENDLQRCICVDARFVLWVIDKYAGATHLIDEMTIAD